MTELINQAEYIGGELFRRNGWRLCTGPSLRGHIVNSHFQPHALVSIGAPLFDLEIAAAREFDLDWVVKKGVEYLAQSDSSIDSQYVPVSPFQYRLALVKTLCAIEDMELSSVPWAEVDDIFPGASALSFNPATDTTDLSFVAFRAQEGF